MNDQGIHDLQMKDISHSYGEHEVLKGVDLKIVSGELACLLGPSGCGKTTLLRLAAGLETLQHGMITLGDSVAANAAAAIQVPPEDRGVGMMFQDYALFPHLTIFENIIKETKTGFIKIILGLITFSAFICPSISSAAFCINLQ